jgi:bla regulator protein blaR1
MKQISAGTITIVLAACAASSQTTSFEVASIKPGDPAAGGTQIGLSPGGTFNAKNVTLKALIQNAYDVRDFQISGGPGWIETQRYDIVAKGQDTGVSEDDIRTMTDQQRNLLKEKLVSRVRALLEERFQLKVHRETKEMPVYALVIAKTGTKIRVDDGPPVNSLGIRRDDAGKSAVTAQAVPLASLVKLLSNQVGRTVLDQTGLKGNYDFKMTFAPDLAAADADGPSIFTALQEQLGLRLDAQKGPVEVLVIDSAQKASEN